MLTKTLACEAGPTGIRVNALAPGVIHTNFSRHNFVDEDGNVDPGEGRGLQEALRRHGAARRVGEAQDVADSILFLVSDAAVVHDRPDPPPQRRRRDALVARVVGSVFCTAHPHPASRIPHPASRIPHPASRIPHPASASRIPHPASRIPHPASRIPHPASRHRTCSARARASRCHAAGPARPGIGRCKWPRGAVFCGNAQAERPRPCGRRPAGRRPQASDERELARARVPAYPSYP